VRSPFPSGFAERQTRHGWGAAHSGFVVSDVERGRRNVGMVNVDRLARALSVDLPTLMAGAEAKRSR